MSAPACWFGFLATRFAVPRHGSRPPRFVRTCVKMMRTANGANGVIAAKTVLGKPRRGSQTTTVSGWSQTDRGRHQIRLLIPRPSRPVLRLLCLLWNVTPWSNFLLGCNPLFNILYPRPRLTRAPKPPCSAPRTPLHNSLGKDGKNRKTENRRQR